MSRLRAFGTALGFVGGLAWAGLVSAAPNAWSFESVAEHPRWVDFVRWVKTTYVIDVPDDMLEQACRKALQVTAGAQLDEPVSACIKGVLGSLDRASEYIDPKKFAEQQATARRGFIGIGLELALKERGAPLLVVQPIEGAPGERVGILPGDRIVELDGVDVLPLSVEEAIQLIRGEAGTMLRVTLRREGKAEPIRLSAKREEVRLLTARVKPLAGNIAYVRINQFNQDTGKQLGDRLNAVRFPDNKAPAGLLLDLRNNSGGLVEGLVQVASLLAPPDKAVLAMTGRDKVEVPRTATGDEKSSSAWREALPVVVLMNDRTAAGAEALAQFLRETRSARLLGQRTFGSAEIRMRRTIGGDAAVTLVTATMSSPLGKTWADGLLPDTLLETQSGRYDFGSDNDLWMQQAAAMLAK